MPSTQPIPQKNDTSSCIEEIQTATNRVTKLLSPYSKCAVVALVIGSIAGLVFAGLGAVQLFGPIGCTGYIGSIAGGGALALLSGGGIMWIAIASCKRGNAPIDHEAIVFALQKLEERPDIEPHICFDDSEEPLKNQPNDQIARLETLCREAFADLELRIKNSTSSYPWSRQEVIDAADIAVKLGYALSDLTLKDLFEFTKNLEKNCTYRDVLTQTDYYPRQSGFCFPEVYHLLRDELYWSLIEQKFVKPSCKAHTSLFYQEGTIQYGWRMLYNDYCTRLRNLINDPDLALDLWGMIQNDVDEESWF